MNDKQFYRLFKNALNVPDCEAFVHEWALSPIWGGSAQDDALADRTNELAAIWEVAHMPIREIRRFSGLTQEQFSERFCIPARSISNWECGERNCPDYLRVLLAQAVGAYKR